MRDPGWRFTAAEMRQNRGAPEAYLRQVNGSTNMKTVISSSRPSSIPPIRTRFT